MKNHMIKRFPVMTLVLFVGLIFLSVDVFTATQVRETIMIANRYKKYEKGPVTLSHQKHAEDYKVACNECHHEYKDGKNVWNEMMGVKRCRECGYTEPGLPQAMPYLPQGAKGQGSSLAEVRGLPR
jgi:cytochrome c peroxidase